MRPYMTVMTLLLLQLSAWSAEPAGTFKPAGALATLPSKAAGSHVEKLQKLGNDAWLDLGAPAADPVWGRALGRSWTPRMVYAGDLRGAFLTACGMHGATFMRNGAKHYNDDLFFYDLNVHRWICIYPGANCKTLQLKLDKHNFEVDEHGSFVPVAYAGHGYNLQTYDLDRHQFVLLFNSDPWWKNAIPQRKGWLEIPDGAEHQGKFNMNPQHPYFYAVASGKWERRFVDGAGPAKTFEGLVEYIPSRKQLFCLHQSKVWFYDFGDNRWEDARAPAAPHSGYDCTACFDSKREVVYSGKGNVFCAYDVKKNAWTSPESFRPPVRLGGGVHETMTYDSVNDLIVLNVYRQKEGNGLYFFSPAQDKWLSDKPRPLPEALAKPSRMANAFYDPEGNVHYWFSAGDSQDNGTMWVYRYKNR